MPLPKSVIKNSKNGVQYISHVDQAQYTIKELSRAALRDVSKFLRYEIIKKIRNLRGMRKGKRASKAIGYWLRKIEGDLQIGLKANTWYGIDQELGYKNQPHRNFLRDTVYQNIDTIVEIESKYLSAINNSDNGLSLINENEEREPDD